MRAPTLPFLPHPHQVLTADPPPLFVLSNSALPGPQPSLPSPGHTRHTWLLHPNLTPQPPLPNPSPLLPCLPYNQVMAIDNAGNVGAESPALVFRVDETLPVTDGTLWGPASPSSDTNPLVIGIAAGVKEDCSQGQGRFV